MFTRVNVIDAKGGWWRVDLIAGEVVSLCGTDDDDSGSDIGDSVCSVRCNRRR